MIVQLITKDLLQDLRHRGEATMKKWADPPTEWISDGVWYITYCVENLTRSAAISREDKKPVVMKDFHEAVPDFRDVFGEVFCQQGQQTAMRGPLLVLQFNHFLKDPFFPRDMPREKRNETPDA